MKKTIAALLTLCIFASMLTVFSTVFTLEAKAAATPTKAILLNDYQVLVVFSEAVGYSDIDLYACYADKTTGTLTPRGDGSGEMAWSGDRNAANAASTQWIYSIHAGHGNSTYGHRMELTELRDFDGNWAGVYPLAGYAANNDFKMCAVVGGTPAYLDVQAAGTVSVTSAQMISESQIRLTFSEAVDISGTPFSALRIVDANNDLQWSGAVPLQWSGTLAALDATKTTYLWTIDAGHSVPISKILNFDNPSGIDVSALESSCQIKLAIEENGGLAPAVKDGLVYNVLAPTGNIAEATNTSSAGADGIYLSIASWDLPFKVVGARAIGTRQVLVEFSEAATFGATAPFVALRLVDSKNNLQWDGPDPLQFYGTYEYTDATRTKIVWTLNAGGQYGGVVNVNDIINRAGALAAFSALECRFAIEEIGADAEDGTIENITNGAGDKLCANKTAFGAAPDGSYTGVTPYTADTSFRVESVAAIGAAKLRIEFSQPVTISGSPFMALRYVDAGNDLQFDPYGGGTPLQWDGSWVYEDATHKSIIWTINPGHGMLVTDILDFNGLWAGVIDLSVYSSLACKFCIEETSDTDDGTIENIVNSAGVKLCANKVLVGSGWDGDYTPVSKFVPSFYIKSAEAISPTKIRVEFTEAVNISGAPFMALRYIDADSDLQTYNNPASPLNGTVLQWDGSWVYEDATHKSIIWTIAAGHSMTVTDILNFTGRWAGEIDLSTYTALSCKFCIEEKPFDILVGDTEDGTVENVVNAAGVKLFAGKVLFGGGWDRTFIAVEKWKPTFVVERVIAVNSRQIVIEFSEPITVTKGAGGKKDPFLALRLVDADNNLQFANGDPNKPLQFYGTFKLSKDHTKIVWTLNAGGFAVDVKNINDIINRTGKLAKYSGLNTMFCIEEYPADVNIGDTEDGTIENITNAAGFKLTATKVAAGGAWDGCYMKVVFDPSYVIPATGDINIVFFGAAALISLVCGAVLIILRKKQDMLLDPREKDNPPEKSRLGMINFYRRIKK